MLDAIATVDNLGMEDSAADVSPTSLESNAPVNESQGLSLQETDFNQALMDMMSSLDTAPDDTNPSLKVASGQSVEAALADAIPGLDPTTVTPADPLAEDSELAEDSDLNQSMMEMLGNLDDLESLGVAFQSVSDGFEGLSNSFEQLAVSFLSQDGNFDTVAIGTEGDDTNADLTVIPTAGDAGDDVTSDDQGIVDATLSDDDSDFSVDNLGIESSTDAEDADFNISQMLNNTSETGSDMGFDIDFDALKINVDQVSRGLQFLVQQLEAAFEGEDLAPTASSKLSS
jgi:hypothetical protein